MSETYLQRIKSAAQLIQDTCGQADVGLILGSGLGDYVQSLEDRRQIAYADIPGFPVSTVEGHAGQWHGGALHGKRVCMMQGRFHGYEGYDLQDVTLPVRVMQWMGVKTLIITNAAGGVNTAFSAGDLMLITDFINFSGKNPLTGPNWDELGPRFPDMSFAYDRELQALTLRTAEELGIKLQEGVYAWLNGPNFESPAEIRMLRMFGADAVGMSTVPETIVARHGGMRVLGLSCISNMAAGVLDQPLNHEEVMETGRQVKDTFRKLLDGVIKGM